MLGSHEPFMEGSEMRKYIAALLFAASFVCTSAWADIRYEDAPEEFSNARLLQEYRSIVTEIALQRAALEDERAWMEEARARKMVDDRIYDELAVIIDKNFARLELAEKAIKKRLAWVESEEKRIIGAESTPRRARTIKDPLIKKELNKKIHRYWWMD